jgi:Flp pilus assembly protein TadG
MPGPSRKTRGSVMMEFALLSPWVIFIFVGLFDWGFYAYSLITLETAARSAVVYTANHGNAYDVAAARTIVCKEMQTLSNVASISLSSSCGQASPVVVTADSTAGPDNESAARVTVTYTLPHMIPIPGLLSGQFTITRVLKMKI